MAFIEACFFPLVSGLAVFALLLGLLANLLAARLLLQDDCKASNDALYDRSQAVYRSRRAARHAALKLVPAPGLRPAARPATGSRPARPYFPDLAYQLNGKRLLRQVSAK